MHGPPSTYSYKPAFRCPIPSLVAPRPPPNRIAIDSSGCRVTKSNDRYRESTILTDEELYGATNTVPIPLPPRPFREIVTKSAAASTLTEAEAPTEDSGSAANLRHITSNAYALRGIMKRTNSFGGVLQGARVARAVRRTFSGTESTNTTATKTATASTTSIGSLQTYTSATGRSAKTLSSWRLLRRSSTHDDGALPGGVRANPAAETRRVSMAAFSATTAVCAVLPAEQEKRRKRSAPPLPPKGRHGSAPLVAAARPAGCVNGTASDRTPKSFNHCYVSTNNTGGSWQWKTDGEEMTKGHFHSGPGPPPRAPSDKGGWKQGMTPSCFNPGLEGRSSPSSPLSSATCALGPDNNGGVLLSSSSRDNSPGLASSSPSASLVRWLDYSITYGVLVFVLSDGGIGVCFEKGGSEMVIDPTGTFFDIYFDGSDTSDKMLHSPTMPSTSLGAAPSPSGSVHDHDGGATEKPGGPPHTQCRVGSEQARRNRTTRDSAALSIVRTSLSHNRSDTRTDRAVASATVAAETIPQSLSANFHTKSPGDGQGQETAVATGYHWRASALGGRGSLALHENSSIRRCRYSLDYFPFYLRKKVKLVRYFRLYILQTNGSGVGMEVLGAAA